jgi:hypothetical protein
MLNIIKPFDCCFYLQFSFEFKKKNLIISLGTNEKIKILSLKLQQTKSGLT